jgi:hypothetical protein
MNQPVRITTDFPSVEETARIVGVPLSRAKELVELASTSQLVFKRSAGRPATRKGSTRRARSRGRRS